MKPKVVTIVGPTGAGKSALGIFLAKKFAGEIVSADSRQIYKELSIGTAKPEGHWEMIESERRYVSDGVIHSLVDEIDPKEEFFLPDFLSRSKEAMADIVSRGKLPIVVGGTAQYIYALLENWQIPEVPPNPALRGRLEKLSALELDLQLRAIDPVEADIADLNPRRIIRALEIYEALGVKPSEAKKKGEPLYNSLKIGVVTPQDYEEKINKRVSDMIRRGLEREVKGVSSKYSWELPALQTIGYQEFREYLNGKEEMDDVTKKIVSNTLTYSKRQMTWFKRDQEIKWVSTKEEAEELVNQYMI